MRQPWVWLVLLLIAVASWWLCARSLLFGVFVGGGQTWGLVAAWAVWGVGLPWLYACLKISVEVHPTSLRLRFQPYDRDWVEFPIDEVQQVEVRRRRPWSDLWRLRRRRCRFYGLDPRGEVVQVDLTNGRTFLIGSSRPRDLADAIEGVRHAT